MFLLLALALLSTISYADDPTKIFSTVLLLTNEPILPVKNDPTLPNNPELTINPALTITPILTTDPIGTNQPITSNEPDISAMIKISTGVNSCQDAFDDPKFFPQYFVSSLDACLAKCAQYAPCKYASFYTTTDNAGHQCNFIL